MAFDILTLPCINPPPPPPPPPPSFLSLLLGCLQFAEVIVMENMGTHDNLYQ